MKKVIFGLPNLVISINNLKSLPYLGTIPILIESLDPAKLVDDQRLKGR